MRHALSRPASRFRSVLSARVVRVAAVVTLITLTLNAAAPSAGLVPTGDGWPLPEFVSAFGIDPNSSSAEKAMAGLPKQPSGTAAGKAHHVPASATRDRGRKAATVPVSEGGRPGHGIGALPADSRSAAPVRTSTTAERKGPKGFSERTSKRVADAATPTMDLFKNADGSFTRRVHERAVNFKSGDGSWKPIDNRLEERAGRLRQKANSVDLSFAAGADDAELASIKVDSSSGFSYSMLGATKVAPVVGGDTVTYPGVQPGVDVELTSSPGGFKESLVLHSADTPASWVFPLHLDGLTPRLDDGGGVELRDSTGKVKATIPPGSMEDSRFNRQSGGFAQSWAVKYELTTADGQPALKVTADQAWLKDPARVYPVRVDPSLNLAASGDTYVNNVNSTDKSGENELPIGSWNGTEKANSFLHFSKFDATYSGAKLSGVNLHLFETWAFTCAKAYPFEIHAVTQAWSDTGAKTFPGPAYSPTAIGSLSAIPGQATCNNDERDRSVGTWMTVPLATATFQQWALNAEANKGLAITTPFSPKENWKKFTSSNGPNRAPYLEVNYTPNVRPQIDGQSPPYGSAVTTLTPELLAIGHDTDKWPSALTYDFQVYNTAGAKIASSGWIPARNWVVPASAGLKWGETYLWTVFAYDGSLASTSATTNVFTTPVPQPLVTSGLSQNSGQGFEPNIGNYTTAATDASVSTVGPALMIQRFYNSQDPRAGASFGAGWSSMLDTKAMETAAAGARVANTVVVRYPTGQEIAFGKSADGSYASPPGRYASFTAVSGGGYRLLDKDGTTYTFTSPTGTGAWGITAIADAAGRAETFTYGTQGGRQVITAITGASGRALHLTWSDEHVTSVSTDAIEGADAPTWNYSYAGDQLAKVCPPTSSTACNSYTYSTASQYHGAVMNAGPQSFWRLGEASGAVAASSVLDNQGTDNGKYVNVALGQPGPLQGSASTAAGFDGTSARVHLPGTLAAAAASFQSFGMWFKAAPGDGGVLLSYQSDPLTKNTTTSDYTPSLYIGTSGKLHGQFGNGTAQPINSAGAVNDGKWHQVVLSAAGSTQSMYLDGALVGTIAGTVQPYTPSSALCSYLGAGFIGGGWPDQPRAGGTATASYFKGSLAEAAFFDRTLTAENIAAIYAAGTSPAHLLASVVRPSGSASAKISYDGELGTVSQVIDSNGGAWKIADPAVSGSSQVYSAAVLAAGPTDYWRLGETGTSSSWARDEVNGSYAWYNAVTQGVAGGPFDDPARSDDNTAVTSFNGTSSFLETMDDVPATGPNSVSMWVSMPAGSTKGGTLYGYQTNHLVGTPESTQPTYVPALYVGTDGKLRGGLWTGSVTPMTSTATVNDGKWHHIVLAASRTSQTLYLDGVAVASKNAAVVATTAAYGFFGAGEAAGWPGVAAANPHGYLAAQLAEVAYFDSQLTTAQVTAQFQARAKASGGPVKAVTVTDPGGKPIQHVYDLPTGRQLAEIDALGNKTQYGYDTGGFLRTVTDPNGNITTTEHDVRGNTVSSITCQNRLENKCSTVYYTYYPDATSKVLTPDPRNDQVLTVRDGRSASAADTKYLTSYAYDAKGNRTTVTDPIGRVTKTDYTDGVSDAAVGGGLAPAGLPKLLTTAGGATQSVRYYRSGDVASVTDPAGKVTELTYDGLGNPAKSTETTETFPSLVATASHDALGRVVSESAPAVTNRVTGAVHSPVTTTEYDIDGLVIAQTVADTTGGDAPRTVRTAYNDFGQVASTTDADGRTTGLEYDVYGNTVKETEDDGSVTKTAYDAEGNLLSSTVVGFTGDPDKPSPPRDLVLTSRAYDPAGRLASETDAMGYVTAYLYTDNDLLTAVYRYDSQRPQVQQILESYRYDAASNRNTTFANYDHTELRDVFDAAGRVTTSWVDQFGLKRATTYAYSPDDHVLVSGSFEGDKFLGSFDATYDPMGRMTARTVRNGNDRYTTKWNLDRAGLVTSMTDPNGNTTGYSYDEAGRLTVTAAPAVDAEVGGGPPVSARPTSYVGYNTFGEQTESKDPNGNTAVTTYDAVGRDTSTRLPSYTPPGADEPITPVLTKTYDRTGQLAAETDSLGATTRYTYDQLGRVTKAVAPNDGETRTAYDALGDVLSVTEPAGAVRAATYDMFGRKLTSSDVVRQSGTSYTTQYTYGLGGWLTSVKSPAGVTTSSTYNKAGEALTETDGAGKVTSHVYDGLGRRVKTTLPDGTYSTATFDLGGRPVGSAAYDAANAQLSAESTGYDAAGNVISTTDARGTTKKFGYDATGELMSLVEPISATDSITTTFGYDLGGNRTRFTDGRGNKFLTTYNAWDLPESLTEPATAAHPNLADRTFTTGYDAAGRPVSQAQPGGVRITNSYDVMGNLTAQTGDGAEVLTDGRKFRYDLDGRMTYAAAGDRENAFEYDDRDQLRSATGASGASSFTYTADGDMASRTDAAGTTSYGYDNAGRLSTVNNPGTNVTMTLGYNALSQIEKMTYGTSGNARSFSYDALHRLAGDELKSFAGASIAKIAYAYDPNGNETSKTTTGLAGSSSNTYTYDLADRITSWTSGATTTAYAYDKSGNRTQAGNRRFTYDERNRLATNDTTRYEYTARGTLSQTVTDNGTLGTRTDAFGQVATQSVNPTRSQSYSYDALGRVMRPGFAYSGVGNTLVADGTATYTRGPDDELVGVAAGNTKTMAWTDRHTDVVGLFTATGSTLTGSTTYDPLGKVLATSGMVGNLGYQSEFTDLSTGRINMWARWYNAETGQFDTRDTYDDSPIPDSVSANRYAYAGDDPLTVTDPTGHFGIDFGGLVNRGKQAFKSGVKAATKVVHAGASYVSHQAARATSAVTKTVNRAVAAGKKVVKRAVATAKKVVHRATSYVKKKATQAKALVKKKVAQGRKLVAHAVQRAKTVVKKAVNHVKQVGRAVVAKTTRVVKQVVTKVKDAYDAGAKWVKEHKAVLIEIAAIGVGVVAGLACTAVTGGALAVGCMIGAAAIINLGKEYAQGNIHNGGDALMSLGTGALFGAAGGAGGIIGGKVAGALLKPVASAVGKIGSRVLGGAIGGAVEDTTTQLALNGRVDLSSVATSAAMGGIFGGFTKSGCHSFDPKTPVVMSDGSKKAIRDVRIGDKVLATDPKTGKTKAKSVELLHFNRDRDLTDVKVAVRAGSGGSRTSVLHTTQSHPFWDKTDRKWVLAASLAAGHQLRTLDGRAATVTAVRNYDGAKDMRDLTIEDIHTYYVVAANTPVLVHNCGENIYRVPDEGVKHGRRAVNSGRGSNSAEPLDGQAALDNSVQIKLTSHRRVGMSNGQVVVIDRTGGEVCGCSASGGENNIFHGHVRSDFETSKAMDDARKALSRAVKDGVITP